MHHAFLAIDADMRLGAEVVLVALSGLMHLWIAFLLIVLGGRWSRDDGGIDDGARCGGVGGIGSTFAFQMARTGCHNVTAIARPASARWQQLERDRSIVNSKGERAEVHVTDGLDETIPYDLVLVTLQAQQVEAMLPALGRSAAKWIQFMCNTFDPERLQDAVGANRCSFGMPFVQATVNREGVLNAEIGVGGQKSKMDNKGWVGVFEAALKESFTLIQRLGYQLYPAGKKRLHTSPTALAAGMLWSLSRIPSFRKVLATGINECRALVQALVTAAPHANPPVSIATIRGIEPHPRHHRMD